MIEAARAELLETLESQLEDITNMLAHGSHTDYVLHRVRDMRFSLVKLETELEKDMGQ